MSMAFRLIDNCGKSDRLIMATPDLQTRLCQIQGHAVRSSACACCKVNKSNQSEIVIVPTYAPRVSEIEQIVCEQLNIPMLPACGIGNMIAKLAYSSMRVGWKAVESKQKKIKRPCLVDKATRRAQRYQQRRKR